MWLGITFPTRQAAASPRSRIYLQILIKELHPFTHSLRRIRTSQSPQNGPASPRGFTRSRANPPTPLSALSKHRFSQGRCHKDFSHACMVCAHSPTIPALPYLIASYKLRAVFSTSKLDLTICQSTGILSNYQLRSSPKTSNR
jgi:hypothetical protein